MSIFGMIILNKLNDLPESPKFSAPWEAQAFALAVELHKRGNFEWSEFSEALSQELLGAGSNQNGDDYYLHWLTALEKLVVAKGLTTASEQTNRQIAWANAAEATPHGEPIFLDKLARKK